ncbi:DNA cytosine methyltransferase [Herbaspirillum seropedicae]|uniref:DNA cytosine methyltransferase n=1 Tax=Herbaspirillum seropedicae TaxID=964 RepID=UPI003FCED778
MNELALFAGAGGGILAGKLLGWRTVCAVEINPYRARRLMQRQNEGHLSPFPIWDDVRTFDGRPWRGVVDVVSGGFPCTDISPAGKKVGISGEASGLWVEMARIVRQVRPRYVFVENSSALLHRGIDRVLGDLAAMGFDAAWGVLGSDDIGADHQRERTWILADSMPWEQPMGRDFPGSGWQQKQVARNAHRQAVCEPGFLGKPDGMADRMDRNRAIGDGQDPRVAAAAWRLLKP